MMISNDEKRRLTDAFYCRENSSSKGIYIHIPFCKNKCYYCDFRCFPKLEKKIGSYVDDLLEEIEIFRQNYPREKLDSIYFGGGTPSHTDQAYIKIIMDKLRENFDFEKNIEISLEMNPEDASLDKLKTYKEIGINRLSLGVQTFSDRLLEMINRSHRTSHVYKAIALIKDLAFDNFSLDLMTGLPEQSPNDLIYDLEKAVSLEPKHISVYSLILEEKTRLHKLVQDGKLRLLDEEIDRKYYHKTVKFLEKHGYLQYEISNFAKDDYRSIHNLKYWNCKEYIGFGLNSSSFYDKKRYKNLKDFKTYHDSIEKGILPIEESYKNLYDDLKTDYIIMKMRLKEGINLKEYREIFETDFYLDNKKIIDSYIENGKVQIKDDRIFFTLEGFDISNDFLVNVI